MKKVFEDKDARIFCIYKHTAPDGRYYIGFTHNTQDRWGRGSNYKRAPLFYPLIKEYGWDAITHEVLISGLTLKEACAEEKRLIKEAQDNSLSLNVSRGGLGGGYTGPRKERTEETKMKIGIKNAHPHTKEAIKHFRESCQWRFRPIAVYKEDKLIGEYESINQAATALGITKTRILRALKYNCRSKEYRFEELPNNAVRKQPRKYYYKTKSK